MIRRTFLALTAATAFAMPAFAQDKDIVDTAVAAGSFNTLAAALTAAGLVETLKGEGPFTVFAPTDAAFAALPAGTVEDLLKPENKDKLVADPDLSRRAGQGHVDRPDRRHEGRHRERCRSDHHPGRRPESERRRHLDAGRRRLERRDPRHRQRDPAADVRQPETRNATMARPAKGQAKVFFAFARE